MNLLRGMKVVHVVEENCIVRSCAFHMSFSLTDNEFCIIFDVYVSKKKHIFFLSNLYLINVNDKLFQLAPQVWINQKPLGRTVSFTTNELKHKISFLGYWMKITYQTSYIYLL